MAGTSPAMAIWRVTNRTDTSLRLNAGALDHLCPFLGLRGHEGIGLGGREHDRLGSDIGKARQDRRIGECSVDLAIEPLDDLARRARRRADARERAHLEARNGLARERNVRYCR